ncbi:MAG: hypothetical protein AAF281_14445 [Pseudomonadota bacterium]
MSSPLQNRVTPTGEIVAYPARGLVMGNRGGRLHTDDRRLGRARWRSKHWLICRLAFKNRHRVVMGPGYTELFFLDEATALAAGHRPCFECRRDDAIRFATLFPGAGRTRAGVMDRRLHQERRRNRATAPLDSLPDGAMIHRAGDAYLVWQGQAHLWHITGYGPATALDDGPVDVLTPAATLFVLAAGYSPLVHPSAGGA